MSDRPETDDFLDRRLDRALADIPRRSASPGFTRQVLARLDRADDPSRFPAAPVPASPSTLGWVGGLALAAVLAVALVALWPAAAPHPTPGRGEDGAGTPAETRTAAVEDPALPVVPRSQPPTASSSPAGTGTASETAAGTATPAGSDLNRRHLAATLEQMRREHQRLQRDLRDLRQLAEGSRRIYLGGDETLDLVLELDEPFPGGAAPARYGPARLGPAGGGTFNPRPVDSGGRRFF